MPPVIKKHPLHGDINYNVDVTTEDSCRDCTHGKVCRMKMSDFCQNYVFGTSDHTAVCDGCVNRHVRAIWDKNGFACFKCIHFNETDGVLNALVQRIKDNLAKHQVRKINQAFLRDLNEIIEDLRTKGCE